MFRHLAPWLDAIFDSGGQFDPDFGLIETALDRPAEPLSLRFCCQHPHLGTGGARSRSARLPVEFI
jgi:hypothetical protein